MAAASLVLITSLISFTMPPPPPERKREFHSGRFFLPICRNAQSSPITRRTCPASLLCVPLILTSGLQRLRQGLAGVPALHKAMHHIPLEQFPEVISKSAVRGLIRFPRIKASGLQRIGWIQRYHALLWKGLDHEEKAIALGLSAEELRAAIHHPPVDVLD